MAKALQAYLRNDNITVPSTAKDATLVINLLSENAGRTLASVGSAQQTREYTLTYNVTFELTKPDGTLILGPRTISLQRNQVVAANEVLSSNNLSGDLYTQMRQEAITQMMYILTSNDAEKALKTSTTTQGTIKQ